MAFLKNVLYLVGCLSAWITTAADKNLVPTAENVKWVSLDFKTILTWATKTSNYNYTVQYAWDHENWHTCLGCIEMLESECDLTNCLKAVDRTYTANIQIESADVNYAPEDLPHIQSQGFNPYRYSNISAVNFTVETNGSRVIINITDPLTSIHEDGKQLSIRDILKNDLQYKISYGKSGSTGKRDIISKANIREMPELDAGQSYCLMVAAYIPSRPKATQQGAWSKQLCTHGQTNTLQELSLGAWVGVVFILLTVLIIIVTVMVLCCRCCRQRNKIPNTSQSSVPV
uniref:Tissue factor n=1 Tax=Monopterus albus TaxID=43700 RepID=A0A3Q3JLY7_MONAL|nr:tissue factor-like [Monopterus albus]